LKVTVNESIEVKENKKVVYYFIFTSNKLLIVKNRRNKPDLMQARDEMWPLSDRSC